AIGSALPEVFRLGAYALENQIAAFVCVVIRRYDLSRPVIATDYTHRLSCITSAFVHHPVDDRAAYLEVMVIPTVVFGVDHDRTVSSFVLRDRRRVCHKIFARSLQFVPAIANEIDNRICSDDSLATHCV